MAPSGEHRIEDLGAATIRAAAVAASNAAAALRSEVGRLHTEGKGLTVAKSCEEMTARAGAAEKLSTSLAATAKALTIREDAAKAWNKNAPKDSELETARKAMHDAQQKLRDAANASGDTSAASKALEAAQKRYKELRDKRKQADEAYDKAEKRADLELAKLAPQDISADAPGTTSPGTSPAPGTGSPSTGTGNGKPSAGAPSKTTTTGTAKPSSTPSTTAPATKPSTTETSGGDDLSSLLTQLAAQQQQPQAQQVQPTAAQAAPAAATPTAAVPQQPDKDKDTPQSKASPLDKLLGSDGVLDSADLAGILGAPVALGGGSAPSSTPAAVTPSSPAVLAASAPSATSLSAGTVTQPVTSGTSAQGLHTSSDVTGRSGEARSAFSVGPETKTSGASGGGAGTAPASTTGTRPMGAGGMPMVPMGGMGGTAGGSGAAKDKEQTTLASGSAESDLMHGRHAVDEAVPGGTIARRDGRRSGPPAEAA